MTDETRQLGPAARLDEVWKTLSPRPLMDSQEFDGRGWYGVHPLVVDILASQGRIPASANGAAAGGTE